MSSKGLEGPPSALPRAWAATDTLTLLENLQPVQWRTFYRLEDAHAFADSFKSYEQANTMAGRQVANHWVEVRAALAAPLVQDSRRFRGRRDQCDNLGRRRMGSPASTEETPSEAEAQAYRAYQGD